MMSERNAILSAPDLEPERIEIEQWSGGFWLRGMTGAEYDEWQAQLKDCPVAHRHALMVRFALCTEAGVLLFADEDVPALAAKSGAALDLVASRAFELNGIGPGEQEKKD